MGLCCCSSSPKSCNVPPALGPIYHANQKCTHGMDRQSAYTQFSAPQNPPVLMPSHLALASLHGITACHWGTQVRIEGRSVNCDCFPDLPYLAADTASQAEAGTARQEGNRVAEGARKQPALGQALSLAATAYDCQFSAVLLVACTACMPTLEHISWERCDVKCIRNH